VPNVHAEAQQSSSEFIKHHWEAFEKRFGTNNVGINGKVFEELIALTLVRAEIFPFYLQAKVAFIPNVNYDLLVYSAEVGPVILPLSVL
jgi:hypothetical protein